VEGEISGVFFPIDIALYNIVFGTHTKTAEPIEISFRLMTWVGSTYHVLDGDAIRQGEGAILGENVAAYCKVMGHSTVSCAKMAEPIEIPF